MPPRRSARVAAVAERATSALSPLPLSVVLHIFSLLPIDCRLRCSEVCRGWRSVLLERSLWTQLDLTAASGGLVQRQQPGFLDSLVRCAAARAGGGLQSLRLDDRFTHAALLDVAVANAGALRELHTHGNVRGLEDARARLRERRTFTADEASALLGAAPLLHVLATDLACNGTDVQAARRALRNEAPFGPLRVRQLCATLEEEEAGVVALAADVAAHASLSEMTMQRVPLTSAAALDAVVDAALARRLRSVSFWQCQLSPASTPALARLLGGDALTTLKLEVSAMRFGAPTAAALSAALRANSTLTSLTLAYAGVFHDAAAAATLLGALTGHVNVQTLGLRGNRVADDADQAAVGALVGALVAANAPALTQLELAFCDLGDDGLRALFEALPHNTHLRELDCSHNGSSEAFARDVLLPAVRANTSLRKLEARSQFSVSATEAERIVSRRAAA
jgi:hypothetical protein